MNLRSLIIALFAAWLFIIGCDNEGSDPATTLEPMAWLNSVEVYIPEDTLWFTQGDSARTNFAVIVTDGDGIVMEGVRVNVTLGNPHCGFIDFLNTNLRDTTNAQGRVEMRYTAVGIAGDVTISATAGGVGDHATLVCRAIGTVSVGSVDLSLGVDTLLFTQGETSSTPVTIGVRDTEGNPLQRTRIAIYNETPQLGYLEFLNTSLRDTTDHEGMVRLRFTSLGPSGDAIFTVNVGTITVGDTLTCRMLPDVITVALVNFHYYREGDGEPLLFSYDFEAVFTDGFGIPFAGVQLEAIPTVGQLEAWVPLTDAAGRTTGHVSGILDYYAEYCITVTNGIIEGNDCMHEN